MSKIGEYKFRLRSHNVDFTGRASMKTLSEIVLYCAGENAKENGFGIDDLQKMGITWVLARLSIRMKYLPKFGENISVETWISSVTGHLSERKMLVYDQNKEIIGYASTMWAVIDVKTRKAIQQSQAEIFGDVVVERDFEIEDSDRVRCLNSIEIAKHKATYSDLDINRHVNSCKYIEWILNTIDLEMLENRPFYGVLVNYQYEVLYNEVVSIRKNEKKEFHWDIFNESQNNAVKFRFWDSPYEHQQN